MLARSVLRRLSSSASAFPVASQEVLTSFRDVLRSSQLPIKTQLKSVPQTSPLLPWRL
jgi:hypothetical protein